MASAVLALLALGQSSGSCPEELFGIERSTNANVVVYLVNLRQGGEPDRVHPVRAEWIMLAEDGRREELTAWERALAYGFEVRRAGADEYTLTLAAERRRPIRLRMLDGCLRPFATVAGREALLEGLYVDAAPGGLFPRVRGLELMGSDPAIGEPLRERLSGG